MKPEKPSEGPWYHDDKDECLVRGKGGRRICWTATAANGELKGKYTSRRDGDVENAKLIVRAWTLEAENKRLREALERVRDDLQCTLDQHDRNGPQWTSRESGAEYYDASYVIESATEKLVIIEAALAE